MNSLQNESAKKDFQIYRLALYIRNEFVYLRSVYSKYIEYSTSTHFICCLFTSSIHALFSRYFVVPLKVFCTCVAFHIHMWYRYLNGMIVISFESSNKKPKETELNWASHAICWNCWFSCSSYYIFRNCAVFRSLQLRLQFYFNHKEMCVRAVQRKILFDAISLSKFDIWCNFKRSFDAFVVILCVQNKY